MYLESQGCDGKIFQRFQKSDISVRKRANGYGELIEMTEKLQMCVLKKKGDGVDGSVRAIVR